MKVLLFCCMSKCVQLTRLMDGARCYLMLQEQDKHTRPRETAGSHKLNSRTLITSFLLRLIRLICHRDVNGKPHTHERLMVILEM